MAPSGRWPGGVLLSASASVAIPAAAIFLSPALKAKLSRRLNIAVGLLYTAFVLITMPGARAFYLFLGSADVVLAALVVWYAWSWPRREAT